MANRPSEQAQPSLSNSFAPLPGIPLFTEPEVRRWPHPVESTTPADLCPLAPCEQSEVSLSHLCLVLSHQNQLLSEIKSLLKQLTAEAAQNPEEK